MKQVFRFKVFMQHPYCEWFLHTATNYLEAVGMVMGVIVVTIVFVTLIIAG